jgi:anionic cell wall polymer biosynthesis LytR-Cps2A-Psr (LCP) family protein
METISDIIDTIGGITVNVPIEMSGFGINGEKVELKEGKQDLNGNEAVFFLRYREGYALGDLGRMDAQKIFISSFIKKIKSDFNIEVAVKLLTYRAKNVITDINTSELIAFAVKNVFKIKNSTGFFATLPGSAVFSDEGISYYSVNKKASIEIFKLFDLKITGEFDPSGVFCSDVSSLNQIYYSNDIRYKVYSDKEVENLSPIVKVQ